MTVSINEVAANGLTFRVRSAGSEGEPVILLHGFPETSHMWVPLLERLEAEGYQGIAPDQRGYSRGARPSAMEDYDYRHLVADVLALADASGFERFHLVGHDHGAGVSWSVAHAYPERLLSHTALSLPHPNAFGQAIRNDADQRKRSEYIARFEVVGAAEEAIAGRLDAMWTESSEAERADYRSVFTQEGALTGALNWYRTSLRYDGPDATQRVGEIEVPTLLIWGNQDGAINRTGVDATPPYMKAEYRFVELAAGHWLIQEETERVLDEVMAQITSHPGS